MRMQIQHCVNPSRTPDYTNEPLFTYLSQLEAVAATVNSWRDESAYSVYLALFPHQRPIISPSASHQHATWNYPTRGFVQGLGGNDRNKYHRRYIMQSSTRRRKGRNKEGANASEIEYSHLAFTAFANIERYRLHKGTVRFVSALFFHLGDNVSTQSARLIILRLKLTEGKKKKTPQTPPPPSVSWPCVCFII